MDLFTIKAKFTDVIMSEEALMYHAVKYQSGSRYLLARQCWQYLEARKLRSGK